MAVLVRRVIAALVAPLLVLSFVGVGGASAAAAGAGTSVTAGTVVAWGSNGSGQSGIPAGLSGVIAVAGGGSHSLALKSDGTVVAWGDNTYGQSAVPAGLSSVAAIAAGYGHSLALRSDGTVVAWGSNHSGQTDVPAGLSGVTAIAAGGNHSLALKNDGTIIGWGSPVAANVPPGLSGVTAIAGGWAHSLALRSDGTVVAWGLNDRGQTDVPAGLAGVTAVAAGVFHSLALRSDGTVVAWGLNTYGETTVPPGLSGVTAIAAGVEHSMALRTNGTVVAWGPNTYGETTLPAGLSGVTAIAAGLYHSLAIVPGDVTPPSASPVAVPEANAGGWNNSDVTVSWNWSDDPGGSGIDPASCTQSSTSSGEGALTLTATCSDLAGNQGSATYQVNVDKRAPAVTYSGNAGVYTVDQTVAITCTAADAAGGSGLAATTCADVKAPAYTLPLGATTYSASATDTAGNVGSASTTVTVKVTPSSLCALTARFVQGSAAYQRLPATLRQKIDANTTSACNAIAAITAKATPQQRAFLVLVYKGAVKGLAAGNVLTPAQATLLTGLAQAL